MTEGKWAWWTQGMQGSRGSRHPFHSENVFAVSSVCQAWVVAGDVACGAVKSPALREPHCSAQTCRERHTPQRRQRSVVLEKRPHRGSAGHFLTPGIWALQPEFPRLGGRPVGVVSI